MSWQQIRERKRKLLAEAIPAAWRDPALKRKMLDAGYVNAREYLDTVLPEAEKQITRLALAELARKIAAGELTAVAVATAFCHRAALAHQILNCCVEIFFDEALARARQLDEYYAAHGKTVGPLHGVPVSLKDQVDLAGKDSSIGYCARFGKPAVRNAVLADLLLAKGAVFYVKTTVPIAMMSAETVSNLMGYTHNAVNVNMSSGGSSGGEGALIGAGGSVLGFGTDIGGSIRIPSAAQGLYALKPSTGRISYMHVTNSYAWQELVPSVIGPMGTSLADVHLMFRLIVEAELWNTDPKVLAIPYKPADSFGGKLRFGFWTDDGVKTPQKAILRCLGAVAEKLQAAAHETKNVAFDLQPKLLDTIGKVYGADAYEEIATTLAQTGEPDMELVRSLVVKEGIDKPLDVTQWWQVSREVYECKQEFYAAWKEWGVDVLICPIWWSAGFKPHTSSAPRYTAPFNIADCACVVVPVGRVDSARDGDADWDKMPVCVQVVARRSEEEKALYAAGVVDALVNG
ncbi:hypothetical protein KL947_004186 [Ogataea haglerorum]|nr:hypothetical protein KL947_004186 [Ogataea haglerorum]